MNILMRQLEKLRLRKQNSENNWLMKMVVANDDHLIDWFLMDY